MPAETEEELQARVEAVEATHAALAVERFPVEEDDRLSNLTVGGQRLTWREAAEYWREQAQRLGKLATVLSHLDRCEHGRHEGDVCSGVRGCNGPSHGNPLVSEDRQIGYSMIADPICIPEGRDLYNPDAWSRR